MNLILVRHGQTVENANHIVQGQIHGQLSDRGKQQAQDAAIVLKDTKIDIAISSDLKRCTHTAQHILKYHPNLTLYKDPALREIHFGEYQNKPSSSIDWTKYDNQNGTVPFGGGGESNVELTKRVIDCVNNIYKKYPDKSVLVVTHGGPLRVIECGLSGKTILQRLAEPTPNATVLHHEINSTLKYPNYS